MNSLKLAKKFLLSIAAALALALPLVGGLALQQTAVAQQGREAPPNPNEYLPIVKVAPAYPAPAVARGLEGYVVVRYTISPNGSTENVSVAESSSTLFEQAAIDSALKYKYRPRVENGVPVAVDGVMTRIEFRLEDDDIPVGNESSVE